MAVETGFQPLNTSVHEISPPSSPDHVPSNDADSPSAVSPLHDEGSDSTQ